MPTFLLCDKSFICKLWRSSRCPRRVQVCIFCPFIIQHSQNIDHLVQVQRARNSGFIRFSERARADMRFCVVIGFRTCGKHVRELLCICALRIDQSHRPSWQVSCIPRPGCTKSEWRGSSSAAPRHCLGLTVNDVVWLRLLKPIFQPSPDSYAKYCRTRKTPIPAIPIPRSSTEAGSGTISRMRNSTMRSL